MNINDRKKRILALGESHNHAHILTNGVSFQKDGKILVSDEASIDYETCISDLEETVKKCKSVNPEDAIAIYSAFKERAKKYNAVRIAHVKEKSWVEEEKEIWTGEHTDIVLKPGVYDPILQEVFDPLTQRVERVRE
jgi:hypothetical protein